ncbi:hypothetical protein ABPG72_000234 [Tetrahymena utriculariae]
MFLISQFLLIILSQLISDTTSQFVLHPNPVSQIDLKNLTQSVGVTNCISEDEKYAFVASTYAGIHIIDLSNIYIPKIISVAQSSYAQACAEKNNYLFVADQQEGLVIHNITDKSNPKRITSVSYTENGFKASYQFVLLSPDSQYVFVLSYGFVFTFQITDITNPNLLPFPIDFTFAPNCYTLRFDKSKRFIAIANHILGVTILDISNIQKQYIRASSNPKFVIWDVTFTPDSKAFYALDAYNGLYFADPTVLFDDSKQGRVSLNYELVMQNTDSLVLSMIITEDGSHMLIGHRSTGIKVYQLNSQNYKKLNFIQSLDASYMVITINLSKNNAKYIYVTNGISLVIFQQVTPNINQDYPNMLNAFQSSLTFINSNVNRFGIFCTNSEVIVATAGSSLDIYDVANPFQPALLNSISQQQSNFDNFSIVIATPDFNTLIIAASQSGILTYNIKDKSNPIFQNQYQFSNKGQLLTQATSAKISKDGKKIFVGNSFFGVLIFAFINPSDLSQLQLINVFPNDIACGYERCDSNFDGTKFVCACREIGTIFFQLQNPDKPPQRMTQFLELAVEQALISQNDNLVFLANGYQGLIIVDITDFFNPKKLSQLVLQGWAQAINLLFNENYIVVSQVEKGQLSLINIQDPSNPYEQQRVQFKGESSTNSCLNAANSGDLYFIGNFGLRYLPIKPKITVHTQFEVGVYNQNGAFLYYQTLEQGQQLLVGQNIRITFVQLNSEQNAIINQVYYYRYFEKQILPPWITFLATQQQINLNVDKLGTHNDFSTENKGENILVLEIQVQITPSQLINSSLKIDPDLSSYLIRLLQQNGYLDQNSYLTDKFNPYVTFDLNFYDGKIYKPDRYSSVYDQIQQFIKQTLTFSKIDYPIRFFIISSLKFNYQKKFNNSTDIIQTPSQQVSIFIQITKNGKFVKRIFEGVLASFSDDLTSVKISGQTSFVNAIIKNSIQIANQTADLSQVSITYILSDSNNYDQTINTSLDQIGFINIHKPVFQDKDLSLQQQFKRYFTNSYLPIEDRFQFSFDLNTFQQNDGLPLTYTAYILNGSNPPTQILTGAWIEFNSINLAFSGIRPASAFMQTTWVRIIADDGYSQINDDFYMTFGTVPFLYALQIIVQIGGPILGIIGLWKYRYEIHLFMLERKNMYQNEVAVVGQMFKKQIIIYGNVQEDGLKLWNMLKKQNIKLKENIVQEYKSNNTIDIYEIICQLEKIYYQNQIKFPLIDPREFDFDDSRMVRTIKRLAYQCVLEENPNTNKVYQKLKKYSLKNFGRKDWYKFYLELYPIMDLNQVLGRDQRNLDIDKDIFQEFQKNSNYELLTINQVRQREVKQILNQKSYSQLHNDLINLNSPIGYQDSTDRQQLAKLAPQDNITLENQILKEKLLNKEQKQQKAYVNLNPFPEIHIKQQLIQETLKQMNLNIAYNFNLLAEIMALDASGAITTKPSVLTPSYGESIHCLPYQLLNLQAFRNSKEQGCIQRFLRFFNMSYTSLGFVMNNPLPKWLNFQIIDGVINMWGVPQPNDEAEILIRIINYNGFAIYSFHIIIQDQLGNDMRNKQLLRKYTMQYNPTSRKKKGQGKLLHQSINNIGSQQFIPIAAASKQYSQEPTQLKGQTLRNIPIKRQFCFGSNATINQNFLSDEQLVEQNDDQNDNYRQKSEHQKEKKLSSIQETSIIVEIEDNLNEKNDKIEEVKTQVFQNKSN